MSQASQKGVKLNALLPQICATPRRVLDRFERQRCSMSPRRKCFYLLLAMRPVRCTSFGSLHCARDVRGDKSFPQFRRDARERGLIAVST